MPAAAPRASDLADRLPTVTRRVGGFASRLAQIALFAVAVAILLANFPSMLGYRSLIVLSGSMEPAIPVGSVVAVAPTDLASLQPGDVVTFREPPNPTVLITHRIIGVEGPPGERLFRTKGDANEDADVGKLPERFVVGQVVMAIPVVGYVQRFSGQPSGMFILLLLASGALAGILREPRGASGTVPATVEAVPSPSAAEAEAAAVQKLLLLARGARQAGLTARAFEYACEATNRDPMSLDAWLVRAEVAPDVEASFDALKMALEIDPANSRACAGITAVRRYSRSSSVSLEDDRLGEG